MITYVAGNLLLSPAQTLVNTVNTVGVMGKGIAKEFREAVPGLFEAYAARCASGELTVGRLHLHRTPHKWVLNFPTKRHWRAPSRLEDVEAGLVAFTERHETHGIASAAFPQLGCGHGGLDWESQVRPLMEQYLAPLPIPILVHVRTPEPDVATRRGRKAVAAWLQGRPGPVGYDVFRRDLGLPTAPPMLADEFPQDTPLFDLWREIVQTGLVWQTSLPFELSGGGRALPPYLESIHAVIMPGADEERRPVADLLAEPGALALLHVPPIEGQPAWTASPTPTPSQLSLTA